VIERKLPRYPGMSVASTVKWLQEHHGVSDAQRERRRAFLTEFEALCRRFDVSISHEDGHGSFCFEDFSEGNVERVAYADGGLYADYLAPASENAETQR
jgi:hypothetical protein